MGVNFYVFLEILVLEWDLNCFFLKKNFREIGFFRI